MKYKIYFISILSFTFLTTVFGQKGKCVTDTDPFNAEIKCSYSWPANNKVLYFELKSETTRLELFNEYNGIFDRVIPKGSEIQIKLGNSEIIKKATIEDSYSTKIQMGDIPGASRYTYVIELTKDDITKLSNSSVTLIRYPAPQGGTVDFGEKGYQKKYLKAILEGSKCILSKY